MNQAASLPELSTDPESGMDLDPILRPRRHTFPSVPGHKTTPSYFVNSVCMTVLQGEDRQKQGFFDMTLLHAEYCGHFS